MPGSTIIDATIQLFSLPPHAPPCRQISPNRYCLHVALRDMKCRLFQDNVNIDAIRMPCLLARFHQSACQPRRHARLMLAYAGPPPPRASRYALTPNISISSYQLYRILSLLFNDAPASRLPPFLLLLRRASHFGRQHGPYIIAKYARRES